MFRTLAPLSALTALLLAATPAGAAGQSRPPAVVEVGVGWGGFVDETWIDRTAVSFRARLFATDRLAVGPELVLLRGSGIEHDWTLTGNVTYDLVQSMGTGQRRGVPYLTASVGYLRQTTQVGTGPFTSGEITASGGGGVRLALADRWFIAPEMRIGWEPELLALVHVGLRGSR